MMHLKQEIVAEDIRKLTMIAKRMRKYIVTMIASAGSGHPGGSLSCVEIITALYFYFLRYDPYDPQAQERDRFILSKGHAAPALYAALALADFFPTADLTTLRHPNSSLQGHPVYGRCPGVEMTAGPLGQGLSFANGIALGTRYDKLDSAIYVLLGDGELQEGQIWEAAMMTSHHALTNVTAIIDHNRLQLDGEIEKIKSLGSIRDKFSAFGWDVLEIDGHNFEEIINALNAQFANKNKPTAIVAHTIKGKGISTIENRVLSHGMRIDRYAINEYIKELENNT